MDTRNADSRDHRTPTTTNGRTPSGRPVTTVYMPGSGRRPTIAYAQQQPMYYQPPYQLQSVAATLFGKLTTGQVVDMVAQLFAMLQTLPSAPVATRDAGTDVANLIMYQGALAQHAKRDEQVRTLGSLVGKVMG
ncbi:MAG: hypothetical protein QM831_11890 [Kofleriaceae bacterium]